MAVAAGLILGCGAYGQRAALSVGNGVAAIFVFDKGSASHGAADGRGGGRLSDAVLTFSPTTQLRPACLPR